MMKKLLICSVLLLCAGAHAQSQPQPQSQPLINPAMLPPSLHVSFGAPYLKPADWPDSVALLPKPPAPGTKALKRDEAAQERAVAQHGTSRFELATSDANLGPQSVGTFSCAAGVELGPDTSPILDKLLHRAMSDLGGATGKAKALYKRPRPFTLNNQPSCTPEAEPYLRHDGSYPSGHAAIGRGWGMILAQVYPTRHKRLNDRGTTFGDSRRICNVHWLSDVEAGRMVARAVMTKLEANQDFQTDLIAARAEARLNKTKPIRDCAAEAAALASTR